MFLIHLIYVLVLLINQNCSQTSESSDFEFDLPDLTTSYETDQIQFQIEAYKSSLNDKLIEKNQTDFHKQLKWVSLGNPMLIKTTQNNISRLFHDSSDGFYTFIQILSNHEREILANKASSLIGFGISKVQIAMLPLIDFKCKLIIPIYNSFNRVLIGNVHNFNQNPLRIDFMAPKDFEERLTVEKILLNNDQNDSNLDCTVKAKAKTKKTSEIIKNPQEIESYKIKEKILGKANEVYLTPNHLLKVASEFYFSLNINEDYEIAEFSNLFLKEIIKKYTKSGLTHVQFDEEISLLPKYSDNLKPVFEQIIEIKRDEEDYEYLALNTEKIEELKSLIDIKDFSLQKTISYLNSNKREINKSFSERLKDLNERTKNEIQWKREGIKILPNTLFVAKFEESLFSNSTKFNKITIIESEFEKQFRLNSKRDIGQINFKSDETKLSEEIAKYQSNLNESKYEKIKSKYDQTLNVKNLKIERYEKDIKDVIPIEKIIAGVLSLALLPNGLFASGYSDGGIIIYNENSGLEIKTLIGHSDWVLSLALLPDGSLASGSRDNTIRIWDVNSGLTIKKLTFYSFSIYKILIPASIMNGVSSLANLKDGIGLVLASGYRDGTIRIWNVNTGSTIKKLTGHTYSVMSLAKLKDGTLASGSFDTTIRIWNVKSGLAIKTLTGHIDSVDSLAVLSDGSLASSSGDKTIIIWNVKTGTEIKTLTGHTHIVRSLAVLSDDLLVSGSGDGELRIWDISSGLTIRKLTGHTGSVQALAFLRNGKFASCSWDGTIRYWYAYNELTFTGHTNYVASLALLQDGTLASGSGDETIRIWNVDTGLTIRTLTGHTMSVNSLAVINYDSLASGSGDKTVRIWNINSGETINTLIGHTDSVFSLAVLQDEALASGSGDKTIRIWNVTSGLTIKKLTGHTSTIYSLVLLKDGSLASGSGDKTIRIWDLISGLTIKKLTGHTSFIVSLLTLQDGSLASGSHDGTIRIWDVTSGTTIKTLIGHTHIVYSLAVHPDGTLVSASGDKTIRIWDVLNGLAISIITFDTCYLFTLAFLPDASFVSGFDDKTMRLAWLY